MEQTTDKKMIAEMKSYLSDKAKAKSADDPKAEENLPFESIDSYSTDPVGFSEMSLRMLSRVEFVFDLAAKDNRFSSKYLKRCTQLEKGIKYLGSLCVTKYALQTQGQTFPQLGQLSTEKLYCMTSHHFRKLDQAVSEHMFEHRDVPDKLFDMELRYFNLLERLRSTEVKIEKFHDRYIFGPEDYSPIVHGLAFSEKSRTRSIHKQYDEAPAFRQAPAFAPLAEAGGRNKKSETTGNKKSEIRNKNLSSSNEEGRMKKEEQVSGFSDQGSEVTAAPDLEGASCRRGLTPSVTGLSNPVPKDAKNQVSGIRDQGSEVTAAPDLEGSPRRRGLTPAVTGLSNPVPEDAKNQKEEQSSENEEGRSKNEERIEEQGATIEEKEEVSPSTLAPVPPDRFSPAREACPWSEALSPHQNRTKSVPYGERIPAAPSANAENQKSETRNQREQLSKTGTTRKVAEELHKNEEGRSKNEERIEEQGPRIEEVTAAPDLEGAPRRRGLTPAVTDTAENLPLCLEIMKRVMERSRESDDNSLTFMIDEMEFLAADPLFARLDPRLANDLRKILEKGPPD